jgi:DNA ligase-1
VVQGEVVASLEDMERRHATWVQLGFEGSIIRATNGSHKQGRSTVREGGLLRIKDFIEEEAVVVSINEGQENNNVAQINELGRTFRTSHQNNKVNNGLVGSFECVIVKTSKLFKKGQAITVSKGKMTIEQAKEYFEHPETIIGKTIKFKHFPHGVKDQPRFPVFVCVRNEEDM